MTLLPWFWSYHRRSEASHSVNDRRATSNVTPATATGPTSQANANGPVPAR